MLFVLQKSTGRSTKLHFIGAQMALAGISSHELRPGRVLVIDLSKAVLGGAHEIGHPRGRKTPAR